MVVQLAEEESTRGTNAFCRSDNNIRWNLHWHMDFHYKVIQKHSSITPFEVIYVCRALCLDSVTDVTVQGISGPGDLTFYKELLGQMPALRSLVMRHLKPDSSTSALIKVILHSKIHEMKDLSGLCLEVGPEIS